MKIRSKCTHPQAIQDVDELFLQQNRFGEITCLPMTPLQWMGAIRMRLVDYCEVFISSLDSRSDGTHSLQRIQWWVCNAKFLFWWRNKLILDGLSISKCSSLNVNIYPGCWHVCSLAEQIMEFCKINSFARVLLFWSKLKFQWNAAKALQKEISRNRTVFC